MVAEPTWWVGCGAYVLGGKMNPRIRLTSAKVGVEVEAELGNNSSMDVGKTCCLLSQRNSSVVCDL